MYAKINKKYIDILHFKILFHKNKIKYIFFSNYSNNISGKIK